MAEATTKLTKREMRRQERLVRKKRHKKLALQVIAIAIIIGISAVALHHYSSVKPPKDTERPMIADVSIYPEDRTYTGRVYINATITDNVGVDVVRVSITGPLWLTAINTSMTRLSGTDTYTYEDTFMDLGNYTYFIWAKDKNDNVNVSSRRTFQVRPNRVATMQTSMGTIKFELYEKRAPTTTANFIKLANDGFFEGLIFHRVIDDFMIQGGGFDADMTKKESPYGTIALEIHPELRHVNGAVAMARTNDPNSATSQFYMCDGAQPDLDDNYAVFGQVIEGMDVVRTIASVATHDEGGHQNVPEDDVVITSITVSDI